MKRARISFRTNIWRIKTAVEESDWEYRLDQVAAASIFQSYVTKTRTSQR
jgi:hypothetical protein